MKIDGRLEKCGGGWRCEGGGGIYACLIVVSPNIDAKKCSLFTYNPSPHVYVLNFVVDNIWHAYMNTV